MNKKFFKLRVKKGTKIISAAGDYTVSEIPDKALELLEAGSSWLQFTEDAAQALSKLAEQRLKKIKFLRSNQGFTSDVEILDRALDLKIQKPKPEVEPKK